MGTIHPYDHSLLRLAPQTQCLFWGASDMVSDCAGAATLAAHVGRPDVVSDVCKSTKQAARLSDRAALYI